MAFPTIVATGKNATIPHHQTSQQKLRHGFLLLDFGARYQHYCADCSRTIYLGQPNQKEKDIYQVLLQAQTAAINEIKEKRLFSELEQATRKKLGKYSSYCIHSLGHGVGLEIHEQPAFALEAKRQVLPGMVFTIEPGIYLPGKLGLRIEDTVYFDGKKAHVLTGSKKELITVRWK